MGKRFENQSFSNPVPRDGIKPCLPFPAHGIVVVPLGGFNTHGIVVDNQFALEVHAVDVSQRMRFGSLPPSVAVLPLNIHSKSCVDGTRPQHVITASRNAPYDDSVMRCYSTEDWTERLRECRFDSFARAMFRLGLRGVNRGRVRPPPIPRPAHAMHFSVPGCTHRIALNVRNPLIPISGTRIAHTLSSSWANPSTLQIFLVDCKYNARCASQPQKQVLVLPPSARAPARHRVKTGDRTYSVKHSA